MTTIHQDGDPCVLIPPSCCIIYSTHAPVCSCIFPIHLRSAFFIRTTYFLAIPNTTSYRITSLTHCFDLQTLLRPLLHSMVIRIHHFLVLHYCHRYHANLHVPAQNPTILFVPFVVIILGGSECFDKSQFFANLILSMYLK